MHDAPEIAGQLERRRSAVAAEWGLTDEVVLIGSGDLISIPGRADLTYPFRAHSEYVYLTDRNRPGGVLAFDPGEGWVDFVAPVTESDRLWSGEPPGGLDGTTTSALDRWLAARRSRPLAVLGSPVPGSPVPGESADGELTDRLRLALSQVRRPKDAVELHRMRIAAQATRAAFAAVMPMLAEGVSEREAQIELEAAAFRHGGEAMASKAIGAERW